MTNHIGPAVIAWVADLGFEVAWERGSGDTRLTGLVRGDGERVIVTNSDPVFECDEGFAGAWEDGEAGEPWNAYAYIEEGSDEREHLGSAPTREMATRPLPCDAHGQRVGQLQRGEDGEVVNLP